MKKTRLISLLLTAALTASCLPMAVSAADDENLLDGATYTGVQVDTGDVDDEGNAIIGGSTVAKAAFKDSDGSLVDDGNEFVTIAKRTYNLGQGFDINFNATEAEIANQLYIKFDIRQSQPSNPDALDANGKILYSGMRYRCDGSSYTNLFGAALASGNWISTGEQKLTTNGTAGLHTINLIKVGNNTAVHDIDIDNIQVYYKNDEGNPVYLVNVTEDFLTATDESGECVAFVPVLKVSKFTAIAFEDVEDSDYYIADSDNEYNTEVAVKLNKTIAPGVYTLGGEFRLGEFTAQGNASANTFTDGINDANLFIKAGDSVSTAKPIDTVWADYEFSFLVTEATDTLTILVDGEDATVADPQKINFRNLVLTQASSFSEDLDFVNTDNILNDTVVTYNGEWERNSGYLAVPARTSDMTYNFLDIIVPAKPVAGEEYFLALDLRASSGGQHQLIINGGFTTEHASTSQYNTVSPVPTYTSGTAGTVSWGFEARGDGRSQVRYFPTANVWQHIETSFVPMENKTDHMKFSLRGKNASVLEAVDVDNIELWCYDDNGEKVVVYSNAFDNKHDLDTKVGSISSQYAALEYVVVDNYVSVTPIAGGATALYDVADVANKAGEYTFSATVASEAVGGTAYIAVDGKAVTDAVVVTDDGIKLTYTANEAIESIEIVTDIEDVVTISNEILTYYFEAPMGDATNDGKVNPLDVVYIQRYAAGWNGYAALVNADAADVSGNDEVNIYDAVLLARHIAKWVGYETMEDLFGIEDGFDY